MKPTNRLKKLKQQPCKEWEGSRDVDGYGRVWVGGKYLRAHRLALADHLGVPVDSLDVVRHTCDNPPCVNPAHLVNGTQRDNNRDRAERGRSTKVRRDRRKLSDQQATVIRSLYVPRSREFNSRALAAQFNVSQGAIMGILKGRTYVCSD